jgi:hypothetical protein
LHQRPAFSGANVSITTEGGTIEPRIDNARQIDQIAPEPATRVVASILPSLVPIRRSRMKPRDQFAVLLGLGLVVIVGLLLMLRSVSEGPAIGPPQSDSLAFYQYARAIADGHPYRFNANDPPSTGSTSHLYPLLLAAPYAMGARDTHLATAGFALAALLYLLLIGGVWVAARRVAPEAAPLATALVILSGHIVSAVFGQTDMGLFAVLAVWSFCAALYRRWIALGLLLILATFTRPDGALLSIGLLALSLLPVGTDRRPNFGLFTASLMGLAALLAVLALNRALTGHMQFTSVIGKSLVGKVEWVLALPEIAESLRGYMLGILFGLEDRSRSLILVPVFGGAFATVGLLSRFRATETARAELWWLFALLGTMAMVAVSGQGVVQFDRYFAWLLPGWFLCAAIGVRRVTDRFGGRGAFRALAIVFVGYQLFGFGVLGMALVRSTAMIAAQREFVKTVNRDLPPSSRVGTDGSAWAAYDLTHHTVHNIYGILSPEFVNPESERAAIEVLRHEPATRFDFWLINAPNMSGQSYSVFIGPPLDVQVPLFGSRSVLSLHRADWSSIDGTTLPLTVRREPARLAAPGGEPDRLSVCARHRRGPALPVQSRRRADDRQRQPSLPPPAGAALPCRREGRWPRDGRLPAERPVLSFADRDGLAERPPPHPQRRPARRRTGRPLGPDRNHDVRPDGHGTLHRAGRRLVLCGALPPLPHPGDSARPGHPDPARGGPALGAPGRRLVHPDVLGPPGRGGIYLRRRDGPVRLCADDVLPYPPHRFTRLYVRRGRIGGS